MLRKMVNTNGSMEGRKQTRLDKLAQKLYESANKDYHPKSSWFVVGNNTKGKYRRLAWERLNEIGDE